MEGGRRDFLLLVVSLLASSCFLSVAGESEGLSRVLFLINSQPHPIHAQRATQTRDQIVKELKEQKVESPLVLMLHEEPEPLSLHGGWTYFPTLNKISAGKYEGKFDWLVFLQENAVVNVAELGKALAGKDPKEEHFIGHSLVDEEVVVIHHYDKSGLKYPHPGAGIILSYPLVDFFKGRVRELAGKIERFPKDFNIDPAYELAKVMGNLKKSEEDPDAKGIELEHEEALCVKQGKKGKCAVYPRSFSCEATDEKVLDLAKRTFIGTKTCEKFHDERLPICLDTWHDAALNVEYISEAASEKYNTLVLPGVVNTERGHCNKAMGILKYFYDNMDEKGWDWLVIADDDSLLGVRKLLEELSCYDSHPDEIVHLGQRYGFRVGTGTHGHDYITGGGSMVFNRAAAKKLVEHKHCKCISDNSPDDMHFGGCMANFGVPIVHSNKFHQGRPEAYVQKILEEHEPLSFHKFWRTDPRKTYKTYFEESDKILREYKFNQKNPHQEL